jgi:endonuclease/exonuclease/phosphatase family metal-dependent hydrolase
LVTFNVRLLTENDGPNQWMHRRELFYETVRDIDPDVMGVQEAYASQLKDIQAGTDGYAYVGVGRDDGKEEGEFAAIFFKTARFEKAGDGTFWLSDTPEVVASNTWEAVCNRVCTWVYLTDKETKRSFSVYNAHFDHKSTQARELSPVAIVKQMVAKDHQKHPLVLMGDFNSGPATPQMAYLITGKALLDGQERVSPIVFKNTLPKAMSERFSTYSGWNGRKEGRQIDYVMIAGDKHRVMASEIKRVEKGGRYPSDHYPVTARVVFP